MSPYSAILATTFHLQCILVACLYVCLTYYPRGSKPQHYCHFGRGHSVLQGSLVQCGVVSSAPGLYPLGASSILPSPSQL